MSSDHGSSAKMESPNDLTVNNLGSSRYSIDPGGESVATEQVGQEFPVNDTNDNNISTNERKSNVSEPQTENTQNQTRKSSSDNYAKTSDTDMEGVVVSHDSHTSATYEFPRVEGESSLKSGSFVNRDKVNMDRSGDSINPSRPVSSKSRRYKPVRSSGGPVRNDENVNSNFNEEDIRKNISGESGVLENNNNGSMKDKSVIEGGESLDYLRDSSIGQTDNFDADVIKPTDKFKLRSISASLIRCINMFREYREKSVIDEDPRLSKIAYRHSRRMALGTVQFSTVGIKDELKGLPLVYYDAFVAVHDSVNQAFTAVINNWTTVDDSKESILKNVNCIGIGVSFSASRRMFFTLILGLRSFIGDCFFSHEQLYSVIMAQKVLRAHNLLRKSYGISQLSIDIRLLGIAYDLLKNDPTKVDVESLRLKIDPVPDIVVAFSETNIDPTAQQVVESWLTHTNANDTILGEYNRVGYAFHHVGDRLKCLRIMVRSLHASIIDGTDSVIDPSIHSKKIYQFMNDFRKQHDLEPLKLNKQLCTIAQEHSEFIANGSIGRSPIESEFYIHEVEPAFRAIDVSHISVKELSRAPKAIMKKWRNSTDCVSVLLNRVTDIGVGLCFDDMYICYCSVVIAVDAHTDPRVVNKIISF